jgi:histidine phosphotransferase ChpT
LVLDPELRDALLGKLGDDGVTPRAAAAWLVHSLATDMRGRIQISEPEEGVLVFGAAIPQS